MPLFSDILAHLLKNIIYTYLNIYYLRGSRLKRSPFVFRRPFPCSRVSAFSVFRFHCLSRPPFPFSFLFGLCRFTVVFLAWQSLAFSVFRFQPCPFSCLYGNGLQITSLHQSCQINPIQPFSGVFVCIDVISLTNGFSPSTSPVKRNCAVFILFALLVPEVSLCLTRSARSTAQS